MRQHRLILGILAVVAFAIPVLLVAWGRQRNVSFEQTNPTPSVAGPTLADVRPSPAPAVTGEPRPARSSTPVARPVWPNLPVAPTTTVVVPPTSPPTPTIRPTSPSPSPTSPSPTPTDPSPTPTATDPVPSPRLGS